MSKKAPVPLRIGTLQCVVAEPITDPAARAALDKVRKRAKRMHQEPTAGTTRERCESGVELGGKTGGVTALRPMIAEYPSRRRQMESIARPARPPVIPVTPPSGTRG